MGYSLLFTACSGFQEQSVFFVAEDSSVDSVFTSPFGGGAVPGLDSAPLGAGVAGPDDDVGVGALGISAREGVGVDGAGGVGAGDG